MHDQATSGRALPAPVISGKRLDAIARRIAGFCRANAGSRYLDDASVELAAEILASLGIAQECTCAACVAGCPACQAPCPACGNCSCGCPDCGAGSSGCQG